MMQAIIEADEILSEANLPKYSEAMVALHALAKEIGSIPNIDQHQVFKAWVIITRYSTNSLEH
jgi:hypothetical protein